MTSPSLDALQKLHQHFLQQAAEVGEAIAILERARAPKTPEPAPTTHWPLEGDWKPLTIEESDDQGTNVEFEPNMYGNLTPDEIISIRDGWRVRRGPYEIAFNGKILVYRKLDDAA